MTMRGFLDSVPFGIQPASSHASPIRITVVMIFAALLGSGGLMYFNAGLSKPASEAVVLMAKGDENVTVKAVRDDEFASNSAELRNPADLVARAKDIPAGSTIVVIGYADARGSATYNSDLARRRADAVAKVLTGADRKPSRTFSAGNEGADRTCFGKPQAEQDGCFQHDRRVEIWSRPAATRTEG